MKASWVAFDSDGFPCGFCSADFYSREQARMEFPTASGVRLVVDQERADLLLIHERGKEGST